MQQRERTARRRAGRSQIVRPLPALDRPRRLIHDDDRLASLVRRMRHRAYCAL